MNTLMARGLIALAGIAGLVGIAALATANRSQAQVVTSGGATLPTLKEQLSTGLLARTPSEQAFVDRVVAKVNDGTLPRKLVDSTFFWARNQMPYPMPYFERALKLRAKRLGIDF